MVSLKCEYESENKVNKHIKIGSKQGLKLSIKDEQGEILTIECSCQPKTTATRVIVYGEIAVDFEGFTINSSVIKDVKFSHDSKSIKIKRV